MSISALNWALDVQVESSSQKLVLLLLANFADTQGRSWPSQKIIAEKACLSVRSVNTALSELEQAGLIGREARWRPGGSRGSDIIFLALPGANLQNLHVGSKDAKSARLTKGAKSADQTRKICTTKHANASPLTTFEPPLEPSKNRSVAKATGSADAAPPEMSLKDRLWLEGSAALVSIGVAEKQSKSMIGRWLRDHGNDAGRILWAIEETVAHGSGDPIPYATRLLADRPSPRPAASARPERTSALTAFADRLEARYARRQQDEQYADQSAVVDHAADGRSDSEVHEQAGGQARRFSSEVALRVVGSGWR